MAVQSSVTPEAIGNVIGAIFCLYCQSFAGVIENAHTRLKNPSTTRVTNLTHFTTGAVIAEASSSEHK